MNAPKEEHTLSKAALSLGLIIISGTYALSQNLVENGQSVSAPPLTGTLRSMMIPLMMQKGRYADGSYTGNAVDVFYGLVQVRAVVQGDRLVAVEFLQFPNDRETSITISNRSLPILEQEAIAAQSAQVDLVSGATETSQGFIASLASALAQAT